MEIRVLRYFLETAREGTSPAPPNDCTLPSPPCPGS